MEPKSYVLVVTRKNDATADHLLHRMADRGIFHLRLDTENFGDVGLALRFPDVRSSVLTVGDTSVCIGQIKGVWLRRIVKPKAPSIQEAEARDFAETEMDFTLRWLIDLLSNYCTILDGETRVLEGRNKFDQLAIAEQLGLCIPTTLVTNDPVVAKDFVKQHGTVAIKSVAGYGRQVEGGFYTIYTNVVTKEMLARFESVRLAPVCLQEYIPKQYELRVTVVGQRVFGCRIDSQDTPQTHVDWRRYDRKTPHSIHEVDPKLSGRLIALMQHYGVRLASFDFVVTPEGRTVFLEMNPATQFLWIENLTGMPITDAIIDEILV